MLGISALPVGRLFVKRHLGEGRVRQVSSELIGSAFSEGYLSGPPQLGVISDSAGCFSILVGPVGGASKSWEGS